MTGNGTALEIEAVSAGYGKTQILREVTMTVEEGGCLGVIGPNGHGKTTLMRVISGLHPAWSGSVRLGGRELLGLKPHRIVGRGIASVPQGGLIFGDLTVEEHLILPLRKAKRRERDAQLRDTYELFPQLADRRKQRARVLSGGEKQMLALARGMLLGGALILIDEPSLGLSPLMTETVYSHIRGLSERGRTLVVVEENPVRLKSIATHMCLIDRGTVVTEGATEAVLGDAMLLQTYLGVEPERIAGVE